VRAAVLPRASLQALSVPAGEQVWARAVLAGWRAGLLRVLGAAAALAVPGGYGALASWAGLVRRRLRVRGGRPAAPRPALSSWRASQASRVRWLRMASRQAIHRVIGAQAGEAAPAAGDAGGGGVFDGGVDALGGGAPPVGPPPLRRGVVVFLPGLGRHLGWHGDGLLGAAGGRVAGRGEDLGPVPAEQH
jgi:hypothetical protein